MSTGDSQTPASMQQLSDDTKAISDDVQQLNNDAQNHANLQTWRDDAAKLAGDAKRLKVDLDSLGPAADRVDEVAANFKSWWDGLAAAAAGHEATLSQCTTEVGRAFFDGQHGNDGYNANKEGLAAFVAQVQTFLADCSSSLREAQKGLQQTEDVVTQDLDTINGELNA